MFADDVLPVKKASDRASLLTQGQSLLPYFGLFFIARLCRTYALYPQYDALHQFPLGETLFLVLFSSGVVLVALQRPWSARKPITGSQMFRIAFHSIWMLGIFSLWLIGMSHLGPLKTLILENAEFTVTVFVGGCMGWRTKQSSQFRGMFFLLAAFGVYLWAEGNVSDWYEQKEQESTTGVHTPQTPLSVDASTGAEQIAAQLIRLPAPTVNFLFFSLPTSFVGFLSIVAALLLSALRKNFARKLAVDIGGSKRLFSLSIACGALFMAPTFLIDYFSGATVVGRVDPHSSLGSICIAGFMLIVVPYYLDFVTNAHMSTAQVFQWTFPAYLFVALVFETLWYPRPVDRILLLVALLIYISNWMSTPTFTLKDSPHLPLYQSTVSQFSWKEVLQFFQNDPQSRKIAIFFSFNLMFMVVEFLYGLWSNSLGLIADAFHMFFDSSALAIGLYAAFVSKWKPTRIYSYGYGRFEVLSGFVNGIMLIFVAVFVFVKAVQRVFDPPMIHHDRLLLVSAAGFCVNMVGIFAFHSHHDHDHNVHGMFLHILADALGSVGVMTSSFLISNYGLLMADPICSLIISVLIFMSAIPLVSHSASILMQRTPHYFDPIVRDALREIERLDGVLSYSEPHFWSYSGPLMVGSLHVQVREDAKEPEILNEVSRILKEHRVAFSSVEVQKESVWAQTERDGRNL